MFFSFCLDVFVNLYIYLLVIFLFLLHFYHFASFSSKSIGFLQ